MPVSGVTSKTTIRLLLADRIRCARMAGQAAPATCGVRPAIAEGMFPGLLVDKATASLGHIGRMCRV
jgi:hypothetical protein